MIVADLELPIVNKNWVASLGQQRKTALSAEFLSAWAEAAARATFSLPTREAAFLAWVLEAFLQVTGQRVPPALTVDTIKEYDNVFEQLVGAIYSTKFCYFSGATRYRHARALLNLQGAIAQSLEASPARQVNLQVRGSSQVLALTQLVDSMKVDPTKVAQWQGWVCQKKAPGLSLTYLPLTPILDRLGDEFTLKLHELCSTHAKTRRGNVLLAARALSEYIAVAGVELRVERLQDAEFTDEFFRSLYKHFLKTRFRDGEGASIANLVSEWRGQVVQFFEEVLFPSGLIARPRFGLPMPHTIDRVGEGTNLRETKTGVMHEKLLTPVPLSVSDDEAIRIIFEHVEADLNRAKSWAWAEVQRVAALLERRKRLAREALARRQGQTFTPGSVGATPWDDPERLGTIAANFEELGYPHSGRGNDDLNIAPFRTSKTRLADELAIPTSTLLFPHCAVIVGEHPMVTPAFLEQLELYDSNGKISGFAGTDAGTILSGAKMRRGPENASQDIVLNDRSAFAVDQIRLLTDPLRKFLRQRGDPAWRRLLLSAGRAFGYPKPIRSLSGSMYSPAAKARLVESLGRTLRTSKGDAEEFAERFSLPALRASAAVLIYFKTRSVEEMARALGHAEYRVKLLDRYLPRVLLEFFNERWIRIFQTGIIVQALQGSPFQLEASGFNTAEDLDRFLLNHALQLPARQAPQGQGELETSRREAIFGVNEEILTTLLSLDLARADGLSLEAKALYWTEVGRELIRYVEASGSSRPDLNKYLERARTRASAGLVRHLCAQ